MALRNDLLEDLVTNGVAIKSGDIEIGAVEIKDGTTDQRATVNDNGELKVTGGASSGGSAGAILLGTDIGGYTFDASAQTITISGMPTIDLQQILGIVNLTDQVSIYSSLDSSKGATIASNVMTLEYDTTAMSDGDELQIFIQYNNSEDLSTGSKVVSVLNPDTSRYTDAELLVTASDIGAADGTYIDQGAEIDMNGYNTLGIFLKFTVSDSTTNTFKILAKHTSAGAEEFLYETPILKTIGDASINVFYQFDTDHVAPYLQIQSAAADVDTGGGTVGTLEIYITKGNK